LAAWRHHVAREKTRRYRDWDYWGKPVPGFGDTNARLLIVGLAPAAHGANRTGRMFTGDNSGNWLYRALYRFGFANQPSSSHREDSLKLCDCYITAALHCAPPRNRPLPGELQNCRPYLLSELALLTNVRVVVALGRIAFDGVTKALKEQGVIVPSVRLAFAHGGEWQLSEKLWLISSFHPSQQNTFTGRLTEPMFDAIFRRVRDLLHD
jgi:uracil-DNA glycosylase family 4